MWVPTHYAVLIIAILLLESAALFAYTLIGLLKSNPLPWVLQPQMPSYPLCQYGSNNQQNQQTVRGGPAANIQQQDPADPSVQIITSTRVIYQTVGGPSSAPNVGNGIDLAGVLQGAAAVDNSRLRTSTENNGKMTTITLPASTSTGPSSSQTTSSSSPSDSNDDSKSRIGDIPDSAHVSTTMLSGTPTTISGRDTNESRSTTKTASIHYITSLTLLTSTLPAPKDEHPQSTSTTLIIVQPSAPSKLRR